jgi:hypothetical protein
MSAVSETFSTFDARHVGTVIHHKENESTSQELAILDQPVATRIKVCNDSA